MLTKRVLDFVLTNDVTEEALEGATACSVTKRVSNCKSCKADFFFAFIGDVDADGEGDTMWDGTPDPCGDRMVFLAPSAYKYKERRIGRAKKILDMS